MKTNTKPSLYCTLIMEATRCTAEESVEIEEVMRESIFHSTLDWQTREEFMEGAVLAKKVIEMSKRKHGMRRI